MNKNWLGKEDCLAILKEMDSMEINKLMIETDHSKTNANLLVNLCMAYKDLNPFLDIMVLSATVRGRSRLMELYKDLGVTFDTFHRAIMGDMAYRRGEFDPIAADLIIIEESLCLTGPGVDILLRAVSKTAKIIVLADSNHILTRTLKNLHFTPVIYVNEETDIPASIKNAVAEFSIEEPIAQMPRDRFVTSMQYADLQKDGAASMKLIKTCGQQPFLTGLWFTATTPVKAGSPATFISAEGDKIVTSPVTSIIMSAGLDTMFIDTTAESLAFEIRNK